tara:strand:- start:246 stop:461 length:216 start_codon:yes stop_codon:yes gene_type:complete
LHVKTSLDYAFSEAKIANISSWHNSELLTEVEKQHERIAMFYPMGNQNIFSVITITYWHISMKKKLQKLLR